jgi:hypothetical protein
MPEVGFTTAALGLCANHPGRVIRSINNAAFADGLIETGPAAATVELSIAFKQGLPQAAQ